MTTGISQRYETHITLDAQDDCVLENAKNWTDERGLKWTHIILENGETPSQPMVTFWGTGTLDDQIHTAKLYGEELGNVDIQLIRIKVETEVPHPHNTRDENSDHTTKIRYFEHHVKLSLGRKFNVNTLIKHVYPFGARLSSNARRQRTDGTQERFVTQRVFDGDANRASQALQNLMNTLTTMQVQILEVESEAVLFDSNLELDRGWMTNE